MQKSLAALRGQSSMLLPDPATITTPQAFNAHIDECVNTLNRMKVEEDEDESERESKTGTDRMHRGGSDRSGE